MEDLWGIFKNLFQQPEQPNLNGIESLNAPAGLSSQPLQGSRSIIPQRQQYNPAGFLGKMFNADSSPQLATNILSVLSPLAKGGITAATGGYEPPNYYTGSPQPLSPDEWESIGRLELQGVGARAGYGPETGTGGGLGEGLLKAGVEHVRTQPSIIGMAAGREGLSQMATQTAKPFGLMNSNLTGTNNPVLKDLWQQLMNEYGNKALRAIGYE